MSVAISLASCTTTNTSQQKPNTLMRTSDSLKIYNGIKASLPEFKMCHAELHAGSSDKPATKIELIFDISLDGQVSDSKTSLIKSNIRDTDSFEKCMRSHMNKVNVPVQLLRPIKNKPFMFDFANNKFGGGGLTAHEINRTIKKNVSLFRKCYSDFIAIKENKNKDGGIVLNFTIGPAGKVTSSKTIKASDDMNDKAFKTCNEQIMADLIFPTPRGGGSVTVNYPFNFSSR